METAVSESLVTAVYERPVFYDKSNKLYSSRVPNYLSYDKHLSISSKI